MYIHIKSKGDVGSNNNYMKYNKCLHKMGERENLWHFTLRVHRLSNLFAFVDNLPETAAAHFLYEVAVSDEF